MYKFVITYYRIMLGDVEMPHTHSGVFQYQEEREWYRNCFTQGHTILKEIEFTIDVGWLLI